MSGLFYYIACATLFLLGLHGMLYRPNLVRKLMALNVLQASVILFYLLIAFKSQARPPIGMGELLMAAQYINPLPHALMLTAIVVGIGTTGLALALIIRIHRLYGTLEESEILEKLGRP